MRRPMLQSPCPDVLGAMLASCLLTDCGPISWIIGIFLFPCIFLCPVSLRGCGSWRGSPGSIWRSVQEPVACIWSPQVPTLLRSSRGWTPAR